MKLACFIIADKKGVKTEANSILSCWKKKQVTSMTKVFYIFHFCHPIFHIMVYEMSKSNFRILTPISEFCRFSRRTDIYVRMEKKASLASHRDARQISWQISTRKGTHAVRALTPCWKAAKRWISPCPPLRRPWKSHASRRARAPLYPNAAASMGRGREQTGHK